VVLKVETGTHKSRAAAAKDLRSRVADRLGLPLEAVHVEWLGTDKIVHFSFMLRPWVLNDRGAYDARLAAVSNPLARFVLAAKTDSNCPVSFWYADFEQVNGRPVVVHRDTASGRYCAQDVLSLCHTEWYDLKQSAEARIAADTAHLNDGRLVWIATPSGRVRSGLRRS
jgi:hypothetical protein